MEKGYAAVFIGSGAHQAQKLNVEGSDLKGVMSGIDFLREVNLGRKITIGNDVVVIGGGSTAMDAARLARRLGAGNVRVVYRRTRTEMPALLEELVGAEEEGMEMDFLVNPLQHCRPRRQGYRHPLHQDRAGRFRRFGPPPADPGRRAANTPSAPVSSSPAWARS